MIHIKEESLYQYNGMLLEVPMDGYVDFYKDIERKKYCKKISKGITVISLDKITEDNDYRNKEAITDNSINIECDVQRKIEIEQLKNVLLQLSNEEYDLIKSLFFEQKTIREYANEVNKPFTTIEYQKAKILRKLKKLLKN